MGVVTSHIYVSIDQQNIAQNLIDLKPEQWMFNRLTDVQMEKIMNIPNSYNDYFRNSRNKFIEKRIDIILKQQQVGVKCTDFLDDMIKKDIESKTLKSCNKCDKKWDIKLRVCKVCHVLWIILNLKFRNQKNIHQIIMTLTVILIFI